MCYIGSLHTHNLCIFSSVLGLDRSTEEKAILTFYGGLYDLYISQVAH